MEDFVNRESQFPNRRRLEIVSQTPNEIIADIYREEGNVSESGTPITAQMLNDMKNEFANQGTTIKINDQAQTSVTFTSDPQSQINTLNTNLSAQQSNKANIDASNLTTDNIDSWQNKLNDLPNLIDIQNAQSVPVNVYLSGQATVKETYLSSDGLTWYRIWSDGWKECGLLLKSGNWSSHEVQLPIEFSNDSYTITISNILPNTLTGTYTTRETSINNQTKSSITLWFQNAGSLNKSVYCCGY